MLLARDLNLVAPSDYEALAPQAIEVKRMLAILLQKLRAKKLIAES